MQSTLGLTLLVALLASSTSIPLPTPPSQPIPLYMLRLYQQLTEETEPAHCGHKTTRNLQDLGQPLTCQEYQLQFNLTAIPDDDENVLQAARIHLELTKDLHHWRATNSFTRSSFRLHLGHGARKTRVIRCEDEPEVGGREIVFDVTQIAREIRENGSGNVDFTLVIDGEPPLPACPPDAIQFEAMMEVETASLEQISCEQDGGDAILVRRKRLAPAGGGEVKNASGVCQRFPLAINFREIGWDSWVVAPATYNAYFCGGTCPFPINDHLNASNHAVVQNLMHSFQPYVPPACCAPTKLAPMSMLYYEHNSSLVLKTYEDMVVDECGCQ